MALYLSNILDFNILSGCLVISKQQYSCLVKQFPLFPKIIHGIFIENKRESILAVSYLEDSKCHSAQGVSKWWIFISGISRI